MPPKLPTSKKPAPTPSAARELQETEDPLQAVILADSFETRFAPFTQERPRCLLPLVNVPLIEWTCEWLAGVGVQEVVLCCGAHAEGVESFMRDSKWSRPSSPFKLEILRSTSKSIGDAMRDLDKRGIMTGDFLVVYGDIVSNLPLGPALAQHRARRAKDKNAIMTMVLREAGTLHRTKAQGSSPVFVMDPAKDRCLHYEQMLTRQTHKAVELDAELLQNCQEIEVRHDLIDCGIDICTPDVLALWSDNFDYEAPRRGFLHSVLKDYELNGKTIHTHIVKDHYAARVRDLHAYDSVSRDIISRWAYPMCSDSNLQEGQSYRFKKGNVYEEKGVDKAWTCTVGPRTVVGRGAKIGKGSKVRSSVIGRGCRIGENCIVEDSYVWEGAVVDDGSEVRRAIVASGAVVGKGCKISEGALVSYGVRIADGTTISQRKRITRARRETSEAESTELDGDGHEYVPSDSEDDDTKAGLFGSIYSMPGSSLSTDSISTLNSEDSLGEEPTHHERSTGSFVSVASDDSHGAGHAPDSFYNDAVSSIYDALKEGTEVSTIQLELQSLRMTANASEHQVRRALVAALIKHIADVRQSGKATIKQVLGNNTMLFERTIFDKGAQDKGDQVDFLLLVQKELAAKKDGQGLEGVMLQICNELYLIDVLEQEGLEQWWEDERSIAGEGMVGVRSQLEKFMEVLLEEEESESGEEEEEDEEDGDDE